jgi:hypothetical protein
LLAVLLGYLPTNAMLFHTENNLFLKMN